MKKQNLLRIIAILTSFIIALAVFTSCSASEDSNVGDVYDEEIYDGMGKENFSEGSNLPTADEKGDMAEGSEDNTESEYEPKIIKTATVSAETQDFSAAIKQIETWVKELNGYIEQCNIQDRSVYSSGESTTVKYANYVLRIPADKLDGFLSDAGELLNILSTNSSATDVSGDYYDIQARISVLETERAVLEKMLSEAKTVNEMISIEDRLYEVIYEIESYKTALKVYDSKVSYSTVNLSITEVADLTPIDEDISFGTRFNNAVAESWTNFVEFCQEMIIAGVYLIPVLLVLAVVGVVTATPVVAVALIVFLIIKGIIRKRKKTKNS